MTPTPFIVVVENPAPAAPAVGWSIISLAQVQAVEDAAGITTITLPGKTKTDTRSLKQWAKILDAYRAETDEENPVNPT